MFACRTFFDGRGVQLHQGVEDSYQIRNARLSGAIVRARDTKKRMLLLSPTSSGKSLIAYFVSRFLINMKKKGLIIVPTTSLVEQLYGDFRDYSERNNWSVARNVHRIYQGHEKHNDLPISISTWQSMFDQPKTFFAPFNFVIGDEAHQFKAKSLKHIMESLVHADYRMGMTATLDGTDTHKLVLEGLFGQTKRFIKTRELIDRGYAAKLNIKCLVLRYSEQKQKRSQAQHIKRNLHLC
jgi:superfamily II DNA or RNA helicase